MLRETRPEGEGIYLTRRRAQEQDLTNVWSIIKKGSKVEYLCSTSSPGGIKVLMEAYLILEKTPKGYGLIEATEKDLDRLRTKYDSAKEGRNFRVDSRMPEFENPTQGRVIMKDIKDE